MTTVLDPPTSAVVPYMAAIGYKYGTLPHTDHFSRTQRCLAGSYTAGIGHQLADQRRVRTAMAIGEAPERDLCH